MTGRAHELIQEEEVVAGVDLNDRSQGSLEMLSPRTLITLHIPREMTKRLSWVHDNCVVMSRPSKHGTELSNSDPVCRWCGQAVSVKRWKDGKKVYCSSRCLSAGRFPVMLGCAAALTPILIGTILAPDAMFSLFVAGQGATIPPGGFPLPLLVLIWGEIAAACLASLFAWYEARIGWRARQETREWSQVPESGGRVRFERPISGS